MKCSAVIEILNQYIDGALSQSVRESVCQHLAECAECAEEHAQLRTLICESGQLAEYDVPLGLHDRVMAAVAAEKCAHASERLSCLVDYELEPAESEMVMAHVAGCGACSSDLQMLRASAAAAASVGLLSPPPGLMERIIAATSGLRSAQPESVFGRLSGLLSGAGRRAVTATAGAGFVLVVAISLMSKAPAPVRYSPVAELDGPKTAQIPLAPVTGPVAKTPQPAVSNESVRRNEAVYAALPARGKSVGESGSKPAAKLPGTKNPVVGSRGSVRLVAKPLPIPDVAPAALSDEPVFQEPGGPNHGEIAAASAQPATLARAETPASSVVAGAVEKTAFARSASLIMANSDTGEWLKSVKESRQSEKNGVDLVSLKF